MPLRRHSIFRIPVSRLPRISHVQWAIRNIDEEMAIPKKPPTPAANANVVDGFSKRLHQLMDRAGVPSRNRIIVGSRRFDVVPNTFKNWCEKDKIPGKHTLLIQIVDALLEDVPGRHNSKAVAAWLLAGDAVPNPFDDRTDSLSVVELYFQISDIAKSEGLEFDSLPRPVRNLILRRVRTELEKAQGMKSGVHLDDKTTAMVMVMVETARELA